MSADRTRANGDDELEAQLRDRPRCDVPPGLEEALLAAIPDRFGKGTARSARRSWRKRLFLAAAASVAAVVGVRALMLLESPRGRAAVEPEPAPPALNTHAEETRPCDVLPPLP
jgi:hypothetical protein